MKTSEMPHSNEILEIAYEQLTAFFKKTSFRKTPERYNILQKIVSLNGTFQIETLHKELKKGKYPLSKATIYNTIHLFEKAGLVQGRWYGNKKLYELTLPTDYKSLHWYKGNYEIQVELNEEEKEEMITFIERKIKKKINRVFFFIREED